MSRRPDDPEFAETEIIEEPAATEEIIEEEIPAGPPPPRIWPWLLALLLLVIAGGIAWFLLTREDKTTMPNVIGLTEQQARARIAEAELDADVDRRPSRRARGIVFAQVPGAGTQLAEGQRVEILVSSGRLRVAVPEVVGEREAAARRALESAGFAVRVQRVFAGAAKGEVVEQDPGGGSRAAQASTVLIKVSKGRNLARIPDVVGMPENEAVAILRERGFEPRIFDVPSGEPEGSVVAQEPPAGVRAPADARVRINVSTGQEAGETTERPEEPAEGSAVTVPNVVGLAQTPALRRLFNAKLDPIVRYQRSNQPVGRVIAQRPAGGTSARRPAEVTVTVSAGPSPQLVAVPDVTGQDEATARSTLEAEGFRVETISDTTTDAPDGIVLDQQPAAGTEAPRGGVITLWIAAGG